PKRVGLPGRHLSPGHEPGTPAAVVYVALLRQGAPVLRRRPSARQNPGLLPHRVIARLLQAIPLRTAAVLQCIQRIGGQINQILDVADVAPDGVLGIPDRTGAPGAIVILYGNPADIAAEAEVALPSIALGRLVAGPRSGGNVPSVEVEDRGGLHLVAGDQVALLEDGARIKRLVRVQRGKRLTAGCLHGTATMVLVRFHSPWLVTCGRVFSVSRVLSLIGVTSVASMLCLPSLGHMLGVRPVASAFSALNLASLLGMFSLAHGLSLPVRVRTRYW